MTLDRIPFAPRMLLATGLLAGAAVAHAASGYSFTTGYTVTRSQEALVAPGMSTAEVKQALGTPAVNVKYGNEPGPTFTYRVAGPDETLFYVDFDAQGKVLSANERKDVSGGGGDGGGV